MIGLFIFLIFTFLLLKNYKKWAVIFMALQPFLYYFALWKQSIIVWLTIVTICLYPFNYKKPFLGFNKFPFKIPLLAIGISMLITDFLVESVYKHTPSTITSIGNRCILIFILWRIYQSSPQKTLSYFLKSSFLITTIICFYSFIETITSTNPYIDWVINNHIYIGETKFINMIRFGLKRSQSIFPMHTTLAGFCINMSCLLFLGYKKRYIKNNLLALCTIILTFICVFFTGARSGILGILFCIMFVIIYEKKKNTIYLLPIIVLSFSIFFIYSDYFYSILESLVNTESTSGSNTSMRQEQLSISLLFLEKSPLYGNGFNFATTIGNQLYPELYGAESLWFHVIINNGIIGVISHLLVYIYAFMYAIKQKHAILILYIMGALVMQTMSSVPGIESTYILIYLFITNELLKSKQRLCNFH